MTVLDWRSHKIGEPVSCRICSRPAVCRDADNRATHKVCAEQAVTGTDRRRTPKENS